MSLAYFPMFPTDFDADTAHLNFAEDGAYNRLLRLSWRCPDAKMPDDLAWIFRKARAVTAEDQALVEAILAEFFTRERGKVFQKKLARIYAEAHDAHSKRVEAGKTGGHAKALKRRQTASSNATDLPEQCSSNQNQNQNQNLSDGGGGSAHEREASVPGPSTDRELILQAVGVDPVSGLTGNGGRMLGTQADMAEVAAWLDLPGITVPGICAEIAAVMSTKTDGPPHSLRYFRTAIQRLSGALTAPALDPIASPSPKGARNERAAVDRALHRFADELSAGTARIDLSDRDPFAARRG